MGACQAARPSGRRQMLHPSHCSMSGKEGGSSAATDEAGTTGEAAAGGCCAGAVRSPEDDASPAGVATDDAAPPNACSQGSYSSLSPHLHSLQFCHSCQLRRSCSREGGAAGGVGRRATGDAAGGAFTGAKPVSCGPGGPGIALTAG
jgi:hypothetical protein